MEEQLQLHVGGLASATEEHLRWLDQPLRIGDEVRVRVLKDAPVDAPSSRSKIDRAKDLRAQKKYVRDMAKKFGWKIQYASCKT